MRRALKPLALALAGIGFLAASSTEGAPLPDPLEVRAHVQDHGDLDESTRETIREALQADPGFDALLEYHTQRAIQCVRTSSLAEDAAQETMLKIWKGRPEIFLQPHDDIVRYVRTATKRNLYTLLDREARAPRALVPESVDLHSVDGPSAPITAAEDVLATLVDRLDDEHSNVLNALIGGAHSERDLAEATGLTRYAAAQAKHRIARELESLLAA